jgi:hypothetical protein
VGAPATLASFAQWKKRKRKKKWYTYMIWHFVRARLATSDFKEGAVGAVEAVQDNHQEYRYKEKEGKTDCRCHKQNVRRRNGMMPVCYLGLTDLQREPCHIYTHC